MAEESSLSAEALTASFAARKLSAAEVIEACLERIEQVDGDLGAFLSIDAEGARARARELDSRRDRGEGLGRLAAVPIAVKDNLSVAGRPLTCGSRILAGYVAPFTATAVERCLDEGAIVVGKTNLDEFAMGSSCENSALARTRNPWDLTRVPGGSSGGSAAAVAAGCVPLALGSDTGGSVRQPAAFCGVVGFKPTWGRVSRNGLVAFASSLDQVGPISRSVRDAALVFEVVAGADERDATTSGLPVPDCIASIEEGIEGLRIGVLRQVTGERLDPALAEVWRRALDRLEGLGARIVEVSVPNVEAAIAAYYVVANSEASANLARFDGVRYGLRADGSTTLAGMYAASRAAGFGSEVKRRIMLGTHALSSGYHDAYYARARGVVAGLRRQFAAAFEACDLVALPTAPTGAFRLGEKVDDPLAMYLSDIFTTPANLAGLPAIAVPAGFDAEGLPLSLQLVGRPFDEPRLLRAARAHEREAAIAVEAPFHGAAGAA
jgi:aspartyl-tRNA(Asn)/glutamyl-tRNA(Gln) amidotransferase subunit A